MDEDTIAQIEADPAGVIDQDALEEAFTSHPAQGPVEVPMEAEEPSIADEQIQRLFDFKAIELAIGQHRQGLAAAKVNRVLAQAGLVTDQHGMGLHPEVFAEQVEQYRRGLDVLKALMDRLTDNGLPETIGGITVARAVPDNIVAPPEAIG